MRFAAVLGVIGVIVAVGACSQEAARVAEPVPEPLPPVLHDLPARVTIEQRAAVVVPGSDGKVRLAIGDVTGGQVAARITRDGAPEQVLLAETSLKPGDRAPFAADGHRYVLALERLDDAIFGNDSATFVLDADQPAAALSENEKIARLLAAIAALEGATFLRNGDEHDAAEAAAHLRRKLDAAGGRVATAAQFIDGIASRSSFSGKPYEIRLADGTVVPARDWLNERLAEIERATRD